MQAHAPPLRRLLLQKLVVILICVLATALLEVPNVAASGHPLVLVQRDSIDVVEGEQASYTIVLSGRRPTADVTVTVTGTSSGTLEATPSSLTFTDENWNQTQSVLLGAIDNSVAGTDTSTTHKLVHAVNSADGNFTQMHANFVNQNTTVTVYEDDAVVRLGVETSWYRHSHLAW